MDSSPAPISSAAPSSIAVPAIAPAPPPIETISIPRGHDTDVHLPWTLGLGLLLAGAVYLGLSGFRDTYLGTLLLERGLTQLASLYLASATLAFLIVKSVNVAGGYAALRNARAKAPRLEAATLSSPHLKEVRDRLVRAGDPVSLRRARALQAFLLSRRRSLAATQAEEDAVQAQNTAEMSYTVPRVMLWAIPLMGFIGTVVGISSAVNGFSGFLQKAEEIEQIKAGIGNVTTGLAVAFDTTLLALALSVGVMMLLVAVERLENRLLQAIDMDVSDSIISRLPEEDGGGSQLAPESVEVAVRRAVESVLPAPEEIVSSARTFLQAAAEEIATNARISAAGIGEAAQRIHQFQESVVAGMRAQQEVLAHQLEAQTQANAKMLDSLAQQIQRSGSDILRAAEAHAEQSATRLDHHLASVAERLNGVSQALDRRLDLLAHLSDQTSEALALEQSLRRTLHSLEETGDLRSVLAGVRESLDGLNPSLHRLAQPRRIMLVERDEAPQAERGNGHGPA